MPRGWVGDWDGAAHAVLYAAAAGDMARVVVTRPVERSAALAERLTERGHEVVVCSLVALEPMGPERIDTSGYDWAVVTSPTGAEELLRRASPPLPRLAAIGPGTAAALREVGAEPAVVAEVSTQEGLLAAFPPNPGRVLFAAAEDARPLLPDALGADVITIYRTRRLRPDSFPSADLATLASSSAAEALAALEAGVPAASIGPRTTETAERLGIAVLAEAKTHDVDGLVDAVDTAVGRLRSRDR